MAGRRKRRRRLYKDFLYDDTCDGFRVNRVEHVRFLSNKSFAFSVFEADHICIEITKSDGRRSFKKVSVLGEVRKVNSKTSNFNGYKDRIKGR